MRNIAVMIACGLALGSCRDTANRAETYKEEDSATVEQLTDRVVELEKQRVIDSMKAVEATQVKEVHRERIVEKPIIVNQTTPPAEQQRKGWSGAAKGAVIGAGAGAITGAVIDKDKPGRGAVIGGLAGAGVGAGTGAIIDAEKKKKEKK